MSEPHPTTRKVLAPDDPEPVEVHQEEGGSPVFLTCDHAGRRIPRWLGDLGLSAADLQRHIAWDIGAYAVAQRLSHLLDATLVAQIYSRLVIDCNRKPGSETSIPTVSENTVVPGNLDLDADERNAREREIHSPYHRRIDHLLDARLVAGRPTLLVAIHSMTPVFDRVHRPWHISFSYDERSALAHALMDRLSQEPDLLIGDNEPYQVNQVDYTIPVHGTRRDLPRVLVELRQDLVTHERGQREWADRLATALSGVLEELTAS